MQLSTSKYQILKHLQLQGFSIKQASEMQKLSIEEVEKVFVYQQHQNGIFSGDAPLKRSNSIKQK